MQAWILTWRVSVRFMVPESVLLRDGKKMVPRHEFGPLGTKLCNTRVPTILGDPAL